MTWPSTPVQQHRHPIDARRDDRQADHDLTRATGREREREQQGSGDAG
jgi:hypothetical protein